MSETTVDFWSGPFGDSYTDRNRVDWQARLPFWRDIINECEPTSVLEVGCNAGWNLRCIQQIDPTIRLTGIDVNPVALGEARRHDLDVFECDAKSAHEIGSHDLVFTAGVLIHIPPEDLADVMDSIVEASRDYVLAIEYASDTEQELDYRGHKGKLWKRPFGDLYALSDTKLVKHGEAPSPAFDRCMYWLMQV